MVGTGQVKDIAVTGLCVTLIVCAVVLTVSVCETISQVNDLIGTGSQRINSLGEQSSALIFQARQVLQYQAAAINDTEYQKKLTQTINLTNETLRRVNTEAMPELTAGVTDFHRAMDTINSVANQVDTGLLPQSVRTAKALAETAEALRTTPEQLNAAISLIAEKSGLTLDEVRALAASDDLKGVIHNLNATAQETSKTMANVTTITGNVSTASASAPGIAASLEKLAQTSSRFQKVQIIASILSTLVRAF